MGTKITSVPYTIANSGFYYLGRNLIYSGSGTAIYITADDVTLDLMGFSLTNSGTPGSKGIFMVGRTNVEIRNGTVRGFLNGIIDQTVSATKHRAINVRAYGMGVDGYGIGFWGNKHLIKGCNASDNSGTGFYLGGGLITDCVAANNATGIEVKGPATVLGNMVFGNSNHNFYFGNGVATAIMVDRNSAYSKNPNYALVPGTTGVEWGINAGAP